jgi:hypothetical protein
MIVMPPRELLKLVQTDLTAYGDDLVAPVQRLTLQAQRK